LAIQNTKQPVVASQVVLDDPIGVELCTVEAVGTYDELNPMFFAEDGSLVGGYLETEE